FLSCRLLHRLLLCFFHSSRLPPHLHSFPTRRSSDLFGQYLRRHDLHPRMRPGKLGSLVEALRGPEIIVLPEVLNESERKIEMPRSEEHTSELQSPYELVCRLLL